MDFKTFINSRIIEGILRPLVPLLIGAAVVVFIYGVMIFMFSDGGEKKEEGKEYMFWGIIGIFVMVSIWGLVGIVQNTFGLSINQVKNIQIDIPNVNVLNR